VELAAGADAELGEDLAQVVLHGARADEQPRADLGVGQPLAGQPRDLRLQADLLLLASNAPDYLAAFPAALLRRLALNGDLVF
jgi:hypothetical protein